MREFGPIGKKIAHSLIPAFKSMFTFFARVGFEYEVENAHYIPNEGPAILASNHPTYLDPVFVYGSSWIKHRRPVHFMAIDWLFDVPFLGPWIPELGAFPVAKNGPAKGPYYQSIRLLKEGKLVGFFLEGGRSHGIPLMNKKLKTGAIRAAIELDVPLIPITVLGGFNIWPIAKKWKLPRFKPVKVIVHPPVYFKTPENMTQRQYWHSSLDELREIIDEPIKVHYRKRFNIDLDM